MSNKEKWYPKLGEAEQNAEAESHAYQSWVLAHLTEKEMREAAMILKAETVGPRLEELLRVAEARAEKEPANLREIFVKNQARAEALRNTRRRFTEAEREELDSLNNWLFYRNHWSERKQCLVALTEYDSQAQDARDNEQSKRDEQT